MSAQLAPGMAEAMAEQARLQELGPDAIAAYWSEGAREVPTEDLMIPGGAGQPQPARIYRGGDKGTLLYIHGGGWVGGSIALNDPACRSLSALSGWTVLSVSYRLAPEHPYPSGLSDCQAAFLWLFQNGPGQGLRIDRVALGGASAGGNLALALALALRHGRLAGLLLFYPVTGADFSTPSYQRDADGFGLTRARMQECFDLYDPDGLRGQDPAITPLSTPVGDIAEAWLPPTAIFAAEYNVLADDARSMAAKLEGAGVATTLHVVPGVTHGFINRGRLLPAARDSLAAAAIYLKDLQK